MFMRSKVMSSWRAIGQEARRNIMRISWVSSLLAVAAGAFLAVGITVFASNAQAPASWSKEIGTFTSPAAKATITALSAVNGAGTTPGVRIELRHLVANPECNLRIIARAVMCARPDAALFLDSGELPGVIAALDTRVGNGSWGSISDPRCGSIGEYRRGNLGMTVSGLVICGYTFEGRTAMEFSGLLSFARAELARAPK
jgi:hypothetical protein